ncbi:ABC transporter substrate-binding protein [Acetobacteraceae bacterium H6797]|nr:ABC transporter substrate-binding protein [Acetobacteraceae bacterium H6797]
MAATLPFMGSLPGTAKAQPATGKVLNLAVAAPPTSLDPHYHTLSPNNMVAQHLFDTLVSRDAKAQLVPALAESWKMIDDSTWEFKLRQGVKFSNGKDFTADDVVYTIERIPNVINSPGSFAIYTKAITASEVVDPYTIRFKTNGIYPLLPTDLTNVFIISRSISATANTGDFNRGVATVGTGPYRLESYKPDDRVELVRNEDYWGDKPEWQRVNYRFIANNAVRLAALRAGDVQMIDAVPTGDIEALRKEPSIKLAEIPSLRVIYLRLDFEHDVSPYITGPNGEKLDKNPLRDLKVRQALSMAINRDAIVSRIMSGAALASGQMMPPGANGYVPDLKPMPFDPEKAKKLLAEAGYPHGFGITLIGPNNRYINDEQIIQAVGQMWQRIGVKTKVEGMPFSVLAQRSAKNDMSALLLGWATSGEPSSALRANLATRDLARGFGTSNQTGYSNKALDALIEKALTTADDKAREDIFKEAMKMGMDDIGLVPLHMQKNVWALRPGISYDARADEYTLAMGVTSAKA